MLAKTFFFYFSKYLFLELSDDLNLFGPDNFEMLNPMSVYVQQSLMVTMNYKFISEYPKVAIISIPSLFAGNNIDGL